MNLKTITITIIFLLTSSLSAFALDIDFNDYSILSFGTNQDGTGNASISSDGSTLNLQGNLWKTIEIDGGLDISEDTYLYFDFFSQNGAEIQGVGVSNNISNIWPDTAFTVFNTQTNYGVLDYRYSLGEWASYAIPIGTYFTGTYSHLTFYNDEDRSSYAQSADGSFRNVRLSPVPEPATFILLGSGLTGLAFYRRKRK